MPQTNVFGTRVRRRLKEIKQTQRWLANEADLPEQTVSNIINGRYENSGNITQAVPIARALRTSVDYLFGIASRSELPMYPSVKVRRLATMAEILPEPDLDRLLNEAKRLVEQSRKELWHKDLIKAVEALVQQHGGDVEGVLRQLDKLVSSNAETTSDLSVEQSPAPSLFDGWQQIVYLWPCKVAVVERITKRTASLRFGSTSPPIS